jgi:RimJ/RimL family protein N-acetyltransferase
MIYGEKVFLGPFTREHSQEYWQWVNQSDLARQVTRCLPVSEIEHQQWYESSVKRSDAVFFSVTSKATQQYLGNVWLWGVTPVHRSAELRILLGRSDEQNRGLGTEACRLLLKFAFEQLNLNKVYLYVLADNTPARKAFSKSGFIEEGTLKEEFYLDGRYQDALRMSILRSQWFSEAP